MLTGIVVALPEELSTLTNSKIRKGDFKSISGNILLAYSGAGPANAEQATRLLIEQGVDKLISWGCAAALEDKLRPGDLVLPLELISEEGHAFNSDSDWHHEINKLLTGKITLHTGKLSGSSVIISSSVDKIALREKYNGDILDMESTAVAKVATEKKLPFIAIRAVADPLGMNLPDAVTVSLDNDGVIHLPALLFHLLTHPSELPGLIKLGFYFSAAKKTLRMVAGQLDIIVGFQSSK